MGLQMSRVTVSLRHPTAFLQESGAATLKWVGLFEKSSPARTFFSHLSGEAMVKKPLGRRILGNMAEVFRLRKVK